MPLCSTSRSGVSLGHRRLPRGLALTFNVGGRLAVMTKVGVYSLDDELQRFTRDEQLDVIAFDGSQEDVWMAESSTGNVWIGAGAEAAVVGAVLQGVADRRPRPH